MMELNKHDHCLGQHGQKARTKNKTALMADVLNNHWHCHCVYLLSRDTRHKWSCDINTESDGHPVPMNKQEQDFCLGSSSQFCPVLSPVPPRSVCLSPCPFSSKPILAPARNRRQVCAIIRSTEQQRKNTVARLGGAGSNNDGEKEAATQGSKRQSS